MTVCDFYHLSIHQNVYLFYPVSYLNLTLLSSCTQGYQSSLICDCCKTNASQLLESHKQIKEVLFLSSIEEKAMWVSVFYYCNCDSPSHCCSFVAISCLMLLFEGHVACQNLTLTVHH